VYNHEPTEYACPFCQLIAGIQDEHTLSAPSDVIYHDEAVTALIGSHQWPQNPGNVIIVSNEHFENLYDLPVRYATDIHRVARMVALAMKAVYGCDGVSTRQHNEPAGNQDVWHYHLHVTPRYEGDQFYSSQREFMPAEDRARHAARLKSYLEARPWLANGTGPDRYDVAFLGNYTKDTIVSASGTRTVDGGAFNYGAHVAAALGLNVAAVTHLAREDWHVVDGLTALGVDVLARATSSSTCLRLEYPSANVDERIIHVTSTANPFSPAEVRQLRARAIVVGASLRGEVGLDVIETLAAKDSLLAADVQGFVRAARDGILQYELWSEKEAILSYVDILKADAVEAEMLTGRGDIHQAARILSGLGPAEIVLTHREGVLVYADGTYDEAGFFPRELVGRSGRGDTCLAAYVARRLDHSPAEATLWAAAATSLKMEAEGPFCRDAADIEKLIQKRYHCGIDKG
jgi:diadenosine tetraphosphate (Ap4A) HIT family hydrolase/sugar/nucleoside kinase (ribokinase family)